MTPDQLYIIIGATVGPVAVVWVALAILLLRIGSRLDRRIESDKAAADADRRAFQAGMDAFRAEMQRLAERKPHVEGRVEGRGAG